jgi:hypothetical protein
MGNIIIPSQKMLSYSDIHSISRYEHPSLRKQLFWSWIQGLGQTGTTAVDNVRSNNGVYMGTLTVDNIKTSPKVKGSVEFHTNNYIQTPIGSAVGLATAATDYPNFAIGIWFQSDAVGERMLMNQRSTGGANGSVGIKQDGGNKIHFSIHNVSGGFAFSSSTAFSSDGKWHFALCQRINETDAEIWVDGILEGEGTGGARELLDVTTGIGRWPGGGQYYFGQLASLTKWNRCLNQKEIETLSRDPFATVRPASRKFFAGFSVSIPSPTTGDVAFSLPMFTVGSAAREVTDIPWCGEGDDKFYLQSGNFTSVLKTSISAYYADPNGISWDGVNTPFVSPLGGGDKMWLMSGQFTSAVKDSESVIAYTTNVFGISWDGINTPWSDIDTPAKWWVQSGQFTSAVKSSLDASSVDTLPADVSWDGTNTVSPGYTSNKLYVTSGQHTVLVKTSQDISSFDTQAIGCTFDGADTPWQGRINKNMYLVSGQFTSVVKSSISIGAIDGVPAGIETSNWSGRLDVELFNTGDVAFALPLFWMSNPNIIQLPILSVLSSGTPADTVGGMTLPILTVDAIGFAQTADIAFALPIFTVAASAFLYGVAITMPQFTVNGIGLANLGGMALPMFTIEGSQQNLASADWTLPMFTTNTVAQQGFVHSMFATLPQLSVLGYAGQTIGIALPSLTLEAHGSTGYLAIFDYSLPRMTIKVVAEQQETGTFNVSLPRFNLSGNLLTGIVSMPGSNRILPCLPW